VNASRDKLQPPVTLDSTGGRHFEEVNRNNSNLILFHFLSLRLMKEPDIEIKSKSFTAAGLSVV